MTDSDINSVLSVAESFGLAVTREGSYARITCPACGAAKLTVTPDNKFFSNCGCYSRNGYNGGSAANLSYWMRHDLGHKAGQLPPARPTPAPSPARPFDPDYWQSQLDEGLDPTGPGQRYLTRRGLTRETCLEFMLADGKRNGHPTILLPYYVYGQGLVTGRHKSLGQPDQPKVATWGGGNNNHLFGQCQTVISDVLVVTEGEVNACSLYQSGVNAYAIPGENCNAVTLPDNTREHYARIVVWMDKATTASNFADLLGADTWVSSPVVDGVKLDANQMLQDGNLSEFVEGLLWDTTDYIGQELHPITRLALEHRGAKYQWSGNRLVSVSW